MILITMQYFGNSGASSQKGSGGGRASGGGASAKSEAKKPVSEMSLSEQPQELKNLRYEAYDLAAEQRTIEEAWDALEYDLSSKKISKKEFNQKTKEMGKKLDTLRERQHKVEAEYKKKGGKPFNVYPMDGDKSYPTKYKAIHSDDY